MAGLIIVACLVWPVFWTILHLLEISVRYWRTQNDAKIERRRKQRSKGDTP